MGPRDRAQERRIAKPARPRVKACELEEAIFEEACARSWRANQRNGGGYSYQSFQDEVAKEFSALSWPRDCQVAPGFMIIGEINILHGAGRDSDCETGPVEI